MRPAVFFDVFDDYSRHILAGRGFNAFKTWRRVHLHHQWPVVGAQDIDARDTQTHDLGRAYGRHALFRRDLDQAGGAATMQVGTEFPGLRLTLHRSNDLVTHHEAADVGATRFLDVLLDHDVLLQTHEGLDHGFSRRRGFAQHHANALRAFKHFDDQGRAVDHLNQVWDVIR